MDIDPRMNDITNSAFSSPFQNDILNELGPTPEPLDLQPGSSKSPLTKAGSLERQPTTNIPEGQPVLRGFGQPTEVLGSFPNSSATTSSSFYAHPSSIKPLSQASPLVKYGTNPKSHSIAHTLNESMILQQEEQQQQRATQGRRPNKSRKITAQSTPSRKRTTSLSGHPEAEEGGDGNEDGGDKPINSSPQIPIPSSKSPSPMKGPKRLSSMSPTKMDPGAAKALHESIASLLGKRQTPEDDEDNGAGDSLPHVESAAAVESNEASSDGTRAEETTKRVSPGKRKRPSRAKV
jgi:hypothetical protein